MLAYKPQLIFREILPDGDSVQSWHRTLGFLPSFDHPIRSRQHVGRDRQTDLLRGFEIDDQLKLRRLLYREISRLSAFENLVHVSGSAPEQVAIARPVVHEPPVFRIFWPTVYCRESALYREVCNLSSLR